MNKNTRFLSTSLSTLLVGTALSLAGCSGSDESDKRAIELVKKSTWHEEMRAEGEIKAASSTGLSVPGSGWDHRNLVFMVPDGSLVEKGQVVARFDSAAARVKLSQAEVDLVRKELAELGAQAITSISQAELRSDKLKVGDDLNLSKRYANADLRIFERNKILDTLADIGFLGDKQNYLNWKTNQIGARGQAEQALLGSQKETVTKTIDLQRKSLSALELVAPHAGVFRLKERWDGSIPQIGSQMWAGDDFGALPDLEKQVATFSIPEGNAFGLKEGQAVKVRLAGTGLELPLQVTQVSKSATTKSRDTPVKFAEFEAKISEEQVRQHGLKPGQAISGAVNLIDKKEVITVPNISLVQEGDAYFVFVQEGRIVRRQKIELGVRGPVRSEVKSGLSEGMQLVLIPEKKEGKA